MECPVTVASQAAGRRTMTVDDLEDALAAKTLAAPGPAVITDKTRVVIYGCDVGRSEKFLKMLSGLFGDPGEVLAPRRLSLFKLDGSTVQYRQAQTWSVVRKAPLVPAGATAPPGGWPAFRTTFVTEAFDKFARVAIASEITGGDRFKQILTTAASTATTTFAPTFFFEEGVDIFPVGSQSAAEAAASVKPRSNGDPVVAQAQSAAQVDDTTLVTTVSGADAYPANPAKTKFSISIVILAQVLDQNVLIAEGPDYRRLTSSKGLAPSPGPKPTGGGATSGGGVSGDPSAFEEDVKALLDELLADGAVQADVDAVLAALPQGDATDGSNTEDSEIGDSDTGDADVEDPETEDLASEVGDEPPVPDDPESLALPRDEVV
jgi:hypothetical protein